MLDAPVITKAPISLTFVFSQSRPTTSRVCAVCEAAAWGEQIEFNSDGSEMSYRVGR